MSTLVQVAGESDQLKVLEPPPRWFREALMELLIAAMRETGADKGLIRAPGFGDIQLCAERIQNGAAPTVASSSTVDTKSAAYLQNRCALPSHVRRPLGPFTPLGPFKLSAGGLPVSPAAADKLDALVRKAESVIARCQVYSFAARELGVDLSSIVLGNSVSLLSLVSAIAKIARSDLPVLIQAEFGSDVVAVAAAAHCMSERLRGPFVVLGCACHRPEDFRPCLHSAIEEAVGGSLFLSEIDMLEGPMQKDLLGVLASPGSLTAAREIRLLSAASRSLEALAREGRFSRLLHARLELLKLEVPPLRARREDIRPLVEFEIGERLHSSKRMSKEAMAALEAYTWPGNLGELRQAVSRMVVMSDFDCIAIEDLTAHSALHSQSDAMTAAKPPAANHGEERAEEPPIAKLEEGGEQGVEAIALLARSLAAGNATGLTHYGLGLQRALTYVSQRYQTDISLTELAENAYLSASHLSFLFKKMLGLPFKTLLAIVRIEKAKQLLAESPDLSVTEVSLNAGFGDLSHFERTFKRIVGLNPRAFRRKCCKAASLCARVLPGKERSMGERRAYSVESGPADA